MKSKQAEPRRNAACVWVSPHASLVSLTLLLTLILSLSLSIYGTHGSHQSQFVFVGALREEGPALR